jgi:Disulphide bond corrector protein DsbC
MKGHLMVRRSAFGLCVCLSAAAQSGAPQPVQWKAFVVSATPVKAGAKTTIALSGEVQQGWHVYAESQPARGPIPLRIALDENQVARIRGKIVGTSPTKRHDKSFGLETQLYLGDFTLRIPVEVERSSIGKQIIPLNVRFQACNDRTCLPPRTIHLSVPVEVVPKT